jgi:hypothetical protein
VLSAQGIYEQVELPSFLPEQIFWTMSVHYNLQGTKKKKKKKRKETSKKTKSLI